MRGAALAALAVLAGVVLLGAGTATWTEVAVPTAPVDGVQLPDAVRAVTGVERSPLAVVAALPAVLAAVPLALLGTADRLGIRRGGDTGAHADAHTGAADDAGGGGRGAGTGLRAAASALGVLALGLAIAAQVAGAPVEVVVLGDAVPQSRSTPVPILHLLGGAVAALAGLLAWRVPRQPAAAEASRYTVEAAQAGGVPGAPAADAGEDADEWDLAVADPEPDPADPPTDDPRPGRSTT